jgi:hypothetical protein
MADPWLSASTSAALTLAEAKAHLRIPADATDEDTDIQSRLDAARQYVEVRAQQDYSVSCPEPARLAILLLLDHWWEHRAAADSASIAPIQPGVDALLFQVEPVTLV